MGLFLQGRRPGHRRFEYEPRYYDPKKEQDIKRRMRVKSKVRRRRSFGVAYIAVLLFLVVYIYLRLG